MVAKSLLCAAVLLGLSGQVQAACKDDLKDLKPRIDQVRKSNPTRYFLAIKWWGDAMEAQPGSETECLNFLAKARKSLVEPLPQLADCKGPNAYLPACRDGGVFNADLGMPVGPVQPLGNGGLGAGSGLGGSTVAAGPTPPGGRPIPFNPPGSVTAPGPGPEATGTDR